MDLNHNSVLPELGEIVNIAKIGFTYYHLDNDLPTALLHLGSGINAYDVHVARIRQRDLHVAVKDCSLQSVTPLDGVSISMIMSRLGAVCHHVLRFPIDHNQCYHHSN